MKAWCAEQKFSFTSRVDTIQYAHIKRTFWHFANVWMLGNSTCQLVLVRDQEAVSLFRIYSFHSSPVVDILPELCEIHIQFTCSPRDIWIPVKKNPKTFT